MSAIVATDLSKRYGDTVALDGLNLTVEPGEAYGYLGPNGAGKTTTIRLLLDGGAAQVLVCSHLGRPKGEADPKYSLRPVAARLADLLGRDVAFDDPAAALSVLENTRYEPGETKNDPAYAQRLASLADIYVNDAFGSAPPARLRRPAARARAERARQAPRRGRAPVRLHRRRAQGRGQDRRPQEARRAGGRAPDRRQDGGAGARRQPGGPRDFQ